MTDTKKNTHIMVKSIHSSLRSESKIRLIQKEKKITARGIIIKGKQGYIAPTRPESNQKLATIINKGIKCKRMKVCSKFLTNSLMSFMHGFQIVVGVT